jgi:TolA-binding protein
MREHGMTPLTARLGFFIAFLCSLLVGCGSARLSTASDETFFKPLRPADLVAASETSEVADTARVSSWTARADSLLQAMREQQQRLHAIAARLQFLEASRRGGAADSFRIAKKEQQQPSRASLQREQPVGLTYGDALRLCQARRYQEAIDAFEGVLRRGVQEDLQDNCYFWIGVSRFGLKQFNLALVALKRVVDWRGSNKKADAYYLLGRTYEQLGKMGEARSMFETLLKEFPRSGVAPSARQKLRNLKPTD